MLRRPSAHGPRRGGAGPGVAGRPTVRPGVVGRGASRPVAAAARLALALAAFLVLAGCAAAATPAPTLPPALPAGTYTSTAFQPPVTFTVPDGWWKPTDRADFLSLRPVVSDIVGIHLFRDPLPASQDPMCPTIAEPGIATTSLALTAWIGTLPGLVVSNPRLAEVGGLRGTEIDIAIRADWSASCPFAEGIPTVPLFVGADGNLRWVVAGSERLRLSILDVPGGGTVVVDIDAFDGSLWDELLAAATPIVRSFAFDVE